MTERNELAELSKRAKRFGYVLSSPSTKKKHNDWFLTSLIKLFVTLDKLIEAIQLARWDRAVSRAEKSK